MKTFFKWWLGPTLAISIWSTGIPGLIASHNTLTGIMLWIAAWWISQPIPLGLNGLLGITLTIVLGVADSSVALSGFSHKVVFLLLGTFLLAQAMHVHGVNEVLCSKLISNRFLSTRPRAALAAFLIFTGVMSWWFSATAETVMLIPIGLAIFSGLDRTLPLGIAYASLLGGLLFPLGNNQNILAIALLEQQANVQVDFFSWIKSGFPITILSFLILWMVLFGRKRITFHSTGQSRSFSKAQKRVLSIFILLATTWFLPGISKSLLGDSLPILRWFDTHLPEAVSAILAAILLFIIPSGHSKTSESRPLLDWNQAQKIDWNVLLLVGSGLSLSAVLFKSGFASTLANGIVAFAGPDASAFLLAVCVLIPTLAITSFSSNTATGDLMLPIAISVAQKTGSDPVVLAMAVAWTASIGFTIPAATPSVAVALSSGSVTRKDLTRHGLRMDLYCFAAILFAVWMGFAGAR